MKNFAFINNNGEVEGIIATSPASTNYKDGETTSDGKLILELPDDVSTANFGLINWYDRDEKKWLTRDPKPDENHIWDGKWTFDRTNFEKNVRLTRDNRLYASDWTQVADCQLSDSKKAEWVTYRQALRDFPATIDSDITLFAQLTWPTAPSQKKVS